MISPTELLQKIQQRDPNQAPFHQAVKEVLTMRC